MSLSSVSARHHSRLPMATHRAPWLSSWLCVPFIRLLLFPDSFPAYLRAPQPVQRVTACSVLCVPCGRAYEKIHKGIGPMFSSLFGARTNSLICSLFWRLCCWLFHNCWCGLFDTGNVTLCTEYCCVYDLSSVRLFAWQELYASS